MDKILISNSFKNLLQSLGAKTSNSNYAVPVVTAGSGTTAGTPQGYMDMASLASVLGDRWDNDALSAIVAAASSINDCVMGETKNNTMAYTVATKTLTGMPSALSSSTRFWIILIQSSSYDIIQIVCGRGSNQPYFRCRQGNEANPPISWSSWREL